MLGSGGRSWLGQRGGELITAQEREGPWAVRAALCISLFVVCILRISIVVVTVHLFCCSGKLPLS